MKKSILRVIAMALAVVLILATFASCDQQGVQGEKGDAGNGISSIIKTSTEGLVDIYTITFTDGETTTFTVTNGADGEQGIQGIQGVKGEDGHTPVITIQNGYWYIDGVNTNQSAIGVSGSTGNGISNIAKTSTEGLVDTYTITYTNGTTTTFTVTNGAQGIQGIQGVPGKDGHSPVITIQDGYWYIDGVKTNEAVGEGIKGDTGNGISSIEKTNTEGLVDTYTITFTDGTTTTFTVTNGADGNDGKDGINGTNGKDGVDGEDGKDGQDGSDGQTPYIKDGYWWIGETNTNVKAEGSDGKDGQNGANGKDGVDGEDGKDGADGADGQTPYIKDGYWWIGDTNTNVKAEGTDGKDGQNGTNGKDGVDGENGKDGQDGADGQSPYIKDGYWWIGDTNTNVKAEGTDGKDGQNGADGKDGVDGENGKDGEDGKDGADGVSVVNAYVDENLHLWIVLSNGTKIDAGYVGVTTTEPTPDPEPDITEPTIIVSSANASAGATNVEITVALKNNPGVTSMLMQIAFDDDALDLVSMTYNTEIGGTGIPLQSTASPVKAYWAEGFTNVTGDWIFVTLKFNVSSSATAGDYDIMVTYNADDVFNADEINVHFDIINGKITVA